MMSMEVDLGGLFDQNETYDYEDYEYKEDTPRSGAVLPLLYWVELVVCLLGIVGLLGNGLLLAILAKKRSSWSISDTFIFHLSVADVLLLLTLPFRAAQAWGICDWCLNGFLCKIIGALFNINFYCGIYLLFCISLDRYLSIVHSVQLFSQKKPRLAHISCLIIWIGSLILAIPDWIFLVAKNNPAQQVCSHTYPQSAAGQLLSRLPHHILGFLLPAAALIICCAGILLWLQRSDKGHQKQRSIMVILPLVVVFFLCWLPYNITLIVDTARSSAKGSERGLFTALIVTSALGCLHACLRPLLYLGLCGNFRAQTLGTLRRATVESAGSLWGLGVGEKALPDQNHDKEEMEQMTSVDQQVQSA